MIEPHSAQLGASSWILNATFVAPSESVTVPAPFPFDAFAGAAWPLLVATTASSSRAGEEVPLEGEPAAAAVEPAAGLSVVVVLSTATLARGSSFAGSGAAAGAGEGAGAASATDGDA